MIVYAIYYYRQKTPEMILTNLEDAKRIVEQTERTNINIKGEHEEWRDEYTLYNMKKQIEEKAREYDDRRREKEISLNWHFDGRANNWIFMLYHCWMYQRSNGRWEKRTRQSRAYYHIKVIELSEPTC